MSRTRKRGGGKNEGKGKKRGEEESEKDEEKKEWRISTLLQHWLCVSHTTLALLMYNHCML